MHEPAMHYASSHYFCTLDFIPIVAVTVKTIHYLISMLSLKKCRVLAEVRVNKL